MSAIPADSYLDIREAHEKIGRALVQLIALAHQTPLGQLADGSPISSAENLASVSDGILDTNEDAAPVLARIGPTLNLWAWFRFSTQEEGPRCIRPASVAPGDPGRWIEQSIPDAARCDVNRYLAHVEYCADQVPNKTLIDRCRGKFPALFVSPVGDSPEEHSQTLAFHRLRIEYRIRVLSANWRGGVAARFTAPLATEAAEDPGTQRILGDVRRLLIHDLTLLRTLGVTKPILGPMRTALELDAERVLLDAMTVSVIAYTHTPNDPCELATSWRMWLQLQDLLARAALPLSNVANPAEVA